MIAFADALYGTIELPDWIEPFLRIPEFVRLRGVRLSNVDSYEFKDFASTTRWEHGIAVAYLADRCAALRGLPLQQRVHLVLAALLHDVATPPFAHTAEFVLPDFDHEREAQRLLAGRLGTTTPDYPVFESQVPAFWRHCEALSRRLRVRVDPDEVAQLVCGEGDLGFLIAGTLDLDNADNVVRAALHLGLHPDGGLPLELTRWLASQRSVVTEIERDTNTAVQKWCEYREAVYARFYDCSDAELGRQAFLQHIMRRAVRGGLPRDALIWQTDESFLAHVSAIQEDERIPPSLRDLVQRYRLLETPIPVCRIPLDDRKTATELQQPTVADWLERELSPRGSGVMVIVSRRRGVSSRQPTSLLPPSEGEIAIFKLGSPWRYEHMPSWLQDKESATVARSPRPSRLAARIAARIPAWQAARPWLAERPRQERVLAGLQSVGDWSFRLSRNEGIHAYPSTFVYTLPATLIACLGLRGETIMDPFGGTGQTALEAIRHGGSAVTADSNYVANLIARARLTYLPGVVRRTLRELDRDAILSAAPKAPASNEQLSVWFHPKTLEELERAFGFASRCTHRVARDFLLAAFSAILPSCTARHGEQHGYFADNAALARGVKRPPYRDATHLFLSRIAKSLDATERFYAALERLNHEPSEALRRGSVVRANCATAEPRDYGVDERSLAAVVTSPPYLCMSDYSLGHRLSYYWMEPDSLTRDYEVEIGARRRRFSPDKALASYLDAIDAFGRLMGKMIRPRGYLGLVMGEPRAEPFRKAGVLERIDSILAGHKFSRLWCTWRPITWHRNQGYARIHKERVSVHVLE